MAQQMMQALVLTAPHAPLQLAALPKPAAGPGQVLVRIAASAVNPLDLKIRAGTAAHAQHPLPAVLGIDLAGTVEATGPGVDAFRVGDAVYGMAGGVGGHQGSLAEYAAVDARLLARAPANLSLRESAALPLAFITAWEGLVDRACLRPGQRVLVQGGAGGVGRIAIQIALSRGGQVFATASQKDKTEIERLGAMFIDRDDTPTAYVARQTEGEGFDIVFDTVGGAVLDASFTAVRRFGHVVSALGWGTHALAPLSFRAASYSGVFTLLPLLTGIGLAHHGAILREATLLVEAGKLRPHLDQRRFALTTAEDAHHAAMEGSARGKQVVDIEPQAAK